MAGLSAHEVGRLAQRLGEGHYAHAAALEVAMDPRAQALMPPPPEPGAGISNGFVARKDGTKHAFHFEYYLTQARTDPELSSDLSRVWLAGSILTVGDALDEANYFDRSPLLELMRHLRNGVAHGNRFNITTRGAATLAKHPAHNRVSPNDWPTRPIFEITPSLHGKGVLFEFLGPADAVDLIFAVASYLRDYP